ncbi:MAG TPA: hypothetical protein VIH93_06805, partial [Thermoanaerobaculia bacterium]
MNARRHPSRISALLLPSLAIVLFPPGLSAQAMKRAHDNLSSLTRVSEKLAPAGDTAPLDEVRGIVPGTLQDGWAAFALGSAVEWRATVDPRNGRIAVAEGGGIGWIPGAGNALTTADLGQRAKGKVDIAALERIARSFLPRVSPLLGVDASSLALNRGRSGRPAPHVWFVDFDVVQGGMPIEGARVVFRVNNGNLVQFGSENLPPPGTAAPAAVVTREKALAVVADYVGGLSSADALRDPGSLHLLPVAVSNPKFADGFEVGKGRGLAKVWQFTFHRDGVMGTWQARVDAATGELLEFADVNEYAQATGGVYQNSPATGSEIVRPMPYANLSTGGFANSAGIFSGGPLSSTLSGQYARIVDTCGAISLATNAAGDLVFGTSSGTDCTTPGVGGAGNTHASRQQFYQVNRIKEVARGWLPSNAWLGQQLTVNVDLNQLCNAYWNGSTLNFFKSGGGCGNTGEIAAVS